MKASSKLPTMVLQFMLEGLRPCTILCFNVLTIGGHLNRNASIGQLLWPTNFKIYCGLCMIKATNANKNI